MWERKCVSEKANFSFSYSHPPVAQVASLAAIATCVSFIEKKWVWVCERPNVHEF